MAIRTFIFCDRCNPQCIRTISSLSDFKRRNSDDRSWFGGSIQGALKEGWKSLNNKHLCPRCVDVTASKPRPSLKLVK